MTGTGGPDFHARKQLRPIQADLHLQQDQTLGHPAPACHNTHKDPCCDGTFISDNYSTMLNSKHTHAGRAREQTPAARQHKWTKCKTGTRATSRAGNQEEGQDALQQGGAYT